MELLMNANKKFKNSVFTSLFDDPDLLRELYCALDGGTLPPDVPVFINTLENVFVMDIYNDISFEIGGKLVVLIEHQSTINPNMPLRLLMYIAEVYERMIDRKTIYSTKPVFVPWPEFFVLYNGEDPFPDEKILKLSDLFENPQDLGLSGKLKPFLELEVKVININEGRNKKILARCSKLAEYSVLMFKVREFKKEQRNLKEAIKKAVIYCQKHGILKEYLETHGSEVVGMLHVEWNLDDAKAVWYEEAREDEKLAIARNMLSEGSTPEFVQKTTGLSLEEIAKL